MQVSTETLRTHAERMGTELEGQQRVAMAYVAAPHEPPAAEHDPAPGVLVVETDGVMVRYRDRHLDGAVVEGDWHEVRLGVVGGWQERHLGQASYSAAREAATKFAPRLRTEPARRGVLDIVVWRGLGSDGGGQEAVLRRVVVIGDGAKWIWEHVASPFGSEPVEILDWIHCCQHLLAIGAAAHGEGTPQTAAWVSQAREVSDLVGRSRHLAPPIGGSSRHYRAGLKSARHGTWLLSHQC